LFAGSYPLAAPLPLHYAQNRRVAGTPVLALVGGLAVFIAHLMNDPGAGAK